MAKVITQLDIMKYRGMDRAVFPKDTIITPSARDWAKEQGIRIEFEDSCSKEGCELSDKDKAEKKEFLNKIIRGFIQRFKEQGVQVNKENLVEAVIKGCSKMGCKIED